MDKWFTITLKEKDTVALLHLKEKVDEASFTEEQFKEWLHHQKIVYGIDSTILKSISSDPNHANYPVIIAKGKHAEDGKPAYLDIFIGTPLKKAHKDDDYIDFKNLMAIPTVINGQKIARKVHATSGINGTTVYGTAIPAKPGKDFVVKNGENTVFKSSDQCIYSAANGEICVRNNRVHVFPVYRINGDVSLKTGNIDFVGNVYIQGNVPSGFKIKAQGDIRVEGLVEASDLETPGSIYIGSGILGQGKGKVTCGGDLAAHYINQGIVVSGGSIHISQSILHSNCTAAKQIICSSGKGNIVGGIISAGDKVVANEVGSDTYTKTLIIFQSISNPGPEETEVLKGKLDSCKESLQKLKVLEQTLIKKSTLTDQEKMTLQRVQASIKILLEQLSQFELHFQNSDGNNRNNSTLVIKGAIYPNVEVQMGKYKRMIKHVNKQVIMRMIHKEIILESLENYKIS